MEGDDAMGILFDPDALPILAELEGGPVAAAELSRRLGVDAGEIGRRLSRLVGAGYVSVTGGDAAVYEADAERLAAAMERDGNYQQAVDGLTKLDSYLN